jgi:FkbM family methyltransferase
MKITIDNHLGRYTVPNECEKKVCVDIGANTGNFISSQINNFELLHFYEPYKPCFDIVKDKLKDTNKSEGFNEAVFHTTGLKLPLMAHSNHDAGSNGLKTDCLNSDWVDEIDIVTTVCLNTIIQRAGGHINYLKVDCENSEYYLLIDKDLSKIDYIGIELHWHMGEEKYNKLISHILMTHHTNDDYSWVYDLNKEVLFKKNK